MPTSFFLYVILISTSRQYDLLPASITERLMFAITAMHAYGHHWACQLVYNPRMRVGLGLTDGEGVERLWSRLRKLIGITRSSGVLSFTHHHFMCYSPYNIFPEISQKMAY